MPIHKIWPSFDFISFRSRVHSCTNAPQKRSEALLRVGGEEHYCGDEKCPQSLREKGQAESGA